MIKEDPYRQSTDGTTEPDNGGAQTGTEPEVQPAEQCSDSDTETCGEESADPDQSQPEGADPALLFVLPRHKERKSSDFNDRLGCIFMLVVLILVAIFIL